MNDGGALPADASGDRRFADALTQLRQTALHFGVKRVVLCTPPVRVATEDVAHKNHAENLQRYSTWLLSKRRDGWEVVDVYNPMLKALTEAKTRDPAFCFARDGIHPDEAGHWLMAQQIVYQFFGKNINGVTSVDKLHPVQGELLRKLHYEKMLLLHAAWMTKIGHKRPGVVGGPGANPGPPLGEARQQVASLSKQISQLLAAP